MQESVSVSNRVTLHWLHLDRRAAAHVRRITLVLVGLGLVVVLAAHLFLALYGVLTPKELMYGEAVIFGQAERIVRGEPLYQPFWQAPYTVTAYGPVYYWLGAGLQVLFGATFLPGRLLSLAAGLVSAGVVAHLSFKRTASRWSAGFAAVLFLALGFALDTPWFALYRVDVLGVALSLGAVSVLAGGTTYRRILAAGVLAALAVLTKQTLIAATVAGFGWLWLQDRRKAGAFMVLVVGIGGLTALLLETTQGAFLANTIYANVNPASREALIFNLRLLAHYQAALIAIAAVLAVRQLKQGNLRMSDPLIWYWAASALTLVGLAKVGSNHNYWIELAAGTAVLVSAAAATVVRSSRLPSITPAQLGAAGAVALLLVAQVSYVGWKDIARWSDAETESRLAFAAASEDTGGFTRLVERVRTESGDVLAEPLDVVVLAGRQVLFEPYLFTIFEAEGRWDAAPLVERICRGDVRLLVLGYPLDLAEGHFFQDQGFWPTPVLAALRHVMRFESRIGGRYVYTANGIQIAEGAC